MKSFVIRHTEIETLASEAGLAESRGQLTTTQLEVLHKRRLFNLFVPKSLGGLALDLPEAIRLEEQLAYTEGSVGWTTTLCAGASWFVGFLNASLSEFLFANPLACFGGSGMATGSAALQSDGSYLINGLWRYATGAPHLSVFTVNCIIYRDGESLYDRQGNPLVRSFCLLPDEVEVVPDWNTIGLIATASHSFRVSDVRADASRMFDISTESLVRNELIYRFPFMQFAELTLAANYLGMFRRFIELSAIEDGSAQLATSALFQIADLSWQELQRTGTLRKETLEKISTECRELVHRGLRQVQVGYLKTGIKGATIDTEINRVWRDIFTASQHVIFR